ncbi:hypothetical protein DENSPDRAFT_51390 [Dentipellis sp. KUC8613]|nr:hypothetical protein DENSPDRAFT_51390 [Dentipellis sp. KUC8613]
MGMPASRITASAGGADVYCSRCSGESLAKSIWTDTSGRSLPVQRAIEGRAFTQAAGWTSTTSSRGCRTRHQISATIWWTRPRSPICCTTVSKSTCLSKARNPSQQKRSNRTAGHRPPSRPLLARQSDEARHRWLWWRHRRRRHSRMRMGCSHQWHLRHCLETQERDHRMLWTWMMWRDCCKRVGDIFWMCCKEYV